MTVPVPRYIPMLAGTAAAPFSDDAWLFEIKWDGIRAIATIAEKVSLRSRNDMELAGTFPELMELATLAPATVLDGEIVVMNEGKPDMQALLQRLEHDSHGMSGPPVTYIVFDILWRGNEELIHLPLTERRRILLSAVREGPHVVISVPVTGQGEDYYRAAVAMGLEGVIAKRRDSPYIPGMRSSAWLKIRAVKSCDCVITGYTPGKGSRSTTFGALMLGLYEGSMLVPVGKVGTGFSGEMLAELLERFGALVTDAPQLPGIREPVVWLLPVLVCEVGYLEVTRGGKLRMPRFIRLRADREPAGCTTMQLLPAGAKTRGEAHAAPGALSTYHEKRNFAITHEPRGIMNMQADRFVIQKHRSQHLHYDMRLERDGVLKSWAVPKGVPEAIGEKRLAVAVEDHPLEYQTFEGEIPKGEYGAGTVTIWDHGTYDTRHWDGEKIEVSLHGSRLSGTYVLVKFKRAGAKDWLIFRVA